MWSEESERALIELQEIGRQTSAAIAERQQAYRLWQQSRVQLTDTVQRFVNYVYQINVSALKESQFIVADTVIGTIVDGLERYLAIHVNQDDTSHLHLMAEAIRTLRDARGWIIQGLSPDPTKRPTYEEREQMTADSAERALRAITDD